LFQKNDIFITLFVVAEKVHHHALVKAVINITATAGGPAILGHT